MYQYDYLPLCLNTYWLTLVTGGNHLTFGYKAKQIGSEDQHPPTITRKVKGNPLSLMRSQDSHLCVLSGAVFLFTCALVHLKEEKKKKDLKW